MELAIIKVVELAIIKVVSDFGSFYIEEVLQCYIKDLESKYTVDNYSLSAFKRVTLNKGESKIVKLIINKKAFEVVNAEGERILDSKKFKLFVGISQPDSRSVQLTGIIPLEADIELA